MLDMSSKYLSRIDGHALVLGGSGGIGREIVRALVANGARAVTFTYGRNRKAAEELARELAGHAVKTYFESLEVPMHDADVPRLAKFLADAVAAVGEEISVMVNTVGVSPNVPLAEQTIDHPETGWRRVAEVNTIGAFFAARTVAERMRGTGVKGAIVLITSDNASVSWSPISAHYDASKAALEHNVRHLAYHYRPEVRVLGIAPGWVDTPLNATLPADERKDVLSRIWLQRFGEPAEIAKVVAFFAGSGGSFATGTTVVVNGGFR
jgi:NAD(P)-dependent dehydrogenase (short-subunit alcohol dehydrogenase family)